MCHDSLCVMGHNHLCTSASSITFFSLCINYFCCTISNLGGSHTTFLIFPSKFCYEHSPLFKSVHVWIPPQVTTHTSIDSFSFCSTCSSTITMLQHPHFSSHFTANFVYSFLTWSILWKYPHNAWGLVHNHANWIISPQLNHVACLPSPPLPP